MAGRRRKSFFEHIIRNSTNPDTRSLNLAFQNPKFLRYRDQVSLNQRVETWIISTVQVRVYKKYFFWLNPSATQILLYKHKFEAVQAFEANFAP